MKSTLRTLTLLGLLLLVAGCSPSRTDFKPALVSIDPGEGWKRVTVPVDPPACTPRLVGKLGMINALLLAGDTDVQKAADKLQKAFSSTGHTVTNSFVQEPFTTDSGLTGIHLSYTANPGKEGDKEMRSHSFITHNRRGECVSISYITSPDAESPAVLEAIRKTLQVE